MEPMSCTTARAAPRDLAALAPLFDAYRTFFAGAEISRNQTSSSRSACVWVIR